MSARIYATIHRHSIALETAKRISALNKYYVATQPFCYLFLSTIRRRCSVRIKRDLHTRAGRARTYWPISRSNLPTLVFSAERLKRFIEKKERAHYILSEQIKRIRAMHLQKYAHLQGAALILNAKLSPRTLTILPFCGVLKYCKQPKTKQTEKSELSRFSRAGSSPVSFVYVYAPKSSIFTINFTCSRCISQRYERKTSMCSSDEPLENFFSFFLFTMRLNDMTLIACGARRIHAKVISAWWPQIRVNMR